jgi:hypothetical protein
LYFGSVRNAASSWSLASLRPARVDVEPFAVRPRTLAVVGGLPGIVTVVVV